MIHHLAVLQTAVAVLLTAAIPRIQPHGGYRSDTAAYGTCDSTPPARMPYRVRSSMRSGAERRNSVVRGKHQCPVAVKLTRQITSLNPAVALGREDGATKVQEI